VFLSPYNGGPPVASPQEFVVGFHAAKDFLPTTKAGISVPPPVQYPAAVTDGSIGEVHVSCKIEVDGSTSNCNVLQLRGNPAFADAALTAARRAHYTPAWQHGRAVAETNHVMKIVFTPPFPPFFDVPKPPPGVVFSKAISSTRLEYPVVAEERQQQGDVLISCDIGLDGRNHDCVVAGIHGDAAFGPAALAYVGGQTIHATKDGVPIAIAHHTTVIRFRLDRTLW
jgi:TonB family protein